MGAPPEKLEINICVRAEGRTASRAAAVIAASIAILAAGLILWSVVKHL
jgi:hypothetical protein